MSKPYWLKPAPPDKSTHKRPRRRYCNLSKMPPTQKRGLWQKIKNNNPALAELLQSPEIQELKGAFNADILVSLDDLHDDQHSDKPTPRD